MDGYFKLDVYVNLPSTASEYVVGQPSLNFKLLCRIEEGAASVSDVQAINSQSVTCIIDVRTCPENLLAYLLMLLVAVT